MSAYKVVDSIWFGVIGIVRVRPEFGDDKFYIGAGVGADKEKDEQAIAAFGMPFRPKALEPFFEIKQ